MQPPVPISFHKIVILLIVFFFLMGVFFGTIILFLRKRKSNVVTFDAIHIYDLIKLILSIGSFVTVCITLILLILQNQVIVAQTKYTLESVESNVFGVITTQNLAADAMFINNPELRPYFYGGQAITEADPLYNKVEATAEYLLDYFDSLISQLRKYPLVWRYEKESWEKTIVDMLCWSPVLCRYLDRHSEWYNNDLQELKRAAEKQRQQGHRR
jgi:hypothetical protein